MEAKFLTATRIAYDTVAESYGETLRDELARAPADRAVLGLYAETVGGPVLEVGCGPGRIAGHLAGLGVDVSGVDLSPAMVQVARRHHPRLRFEVGSMLALDTPDGALGGLVAWYSVIHVPPARHPELFAEFARVLRPEGRLLLAFQVGDERRHVTSGYGHDGLDLDSYRLPVDRVAADLAAAGLPEDLRLVREPTSPEKTPQAYLIATHRGEPRSLRDW